MLNINNINSLSVRNAVNTTNRTVTQPNYKYGKLSLNGPDKDTVEISFRSTPNLNSVNVDETAKTILSNKEIGIRFGEDLIKLVENKNVSPSEVNKLIQKYIPYDNIKIHPMSEYRDTQGRPSVNSTRAAVTRPSFDGNGNIEKIDIFIPEVDYTDKHAMLEFLDKTSHEVTHIAQFVNLAESEKENYAKNNETQFMNFVQKHITDRLTDKGVTDANVKLIKDSDEKPATINEYDDFMDKAGNISSERIGEYLGFGKDSSSQKFIINQIFDMLYDDMLNKMNYKNDPTILNAIKKYGSYEGLRDKIRQLCAKAFVSEQEAYEVGNIIRKKYNGITAPQTNNDLINILMGMYAQALT